MPRVANVVVVVVSPLSFAALFWAFLLEPLVVLLHTGNLPKTYVFNLVKELSTLSYNIILDMSK